MARRRILRHGFARRLRVESLEDRRMLAVITVDTLDGNSNIVMDGSVSLREAIVAANTNTSVDGSVAGNGPDTIVFAPELTGGRILIGAEFEVTQTLTIDTSALDGGIEVFGNGFTRLVNYTAMTGNLTLRNLELTNGRTTGINAIGGDTTFSGAGIRFVSAGTLTLDGTTVQDSHTEGARANGGGIFSVAGNVALINSAVVNNRTEGFSAEGGGISTSSGAVTMTNSTVAGNLTEGASAPGGGIYTRSGVVTLNNSTIALNETTGTNSDGGGLFVSNTTINPALTIRNSIVADNMVGAGSLLPDVFPDPNVVPTVNYSLVEDIQATGINPGAGTGNLFSIDPMLGLVGDHGGPPTVELLPGSPARDAGNPNFNTVSTPNDQRGTPFVREFNGRIDIGAFEAQTISLVVDSTSDSSDADFSSGNFSLREAIELANESPNYDTSTPDTIQFDGSLSGASILLENDELFITEELTIDASTLAQNVTVDAQHNSRIINFSAPDESTTIGDLNVMGLTLTRGQTDSLDLPILIPAGGGGIRFASTGTLTVMDSVLSDNKVDGPSFDGGGIVTESGNVTLVRSTLSGNELTGLANRGGGIYTTTGIVTLTDSVITDNSTTGSGGRGGGAVYTVSGDIFLTNSMLSNNRTTVEGDGGGIASNSGNVTLTDSTVEQNSTTGFSANGGGIATNTSNITLVRSTLSGNSTAGENASGGGIYSVSGDVSFTDSTVHGNSTTEFNARGGGIHAFIGDVTLLRSTVSGNFTLGDFSQGGGISTNGDLTINDSTISGNHTSGMTSFGGGIHTTDTVRIYGSTITNNSTSGPSADGGGIFISSGGIPFFLLQNSIVAGNSVSQANAPDLRPEPSGNFDIDFSLIGDTSGSIVIAATGTGNLLNVDPLLGPLTSLGGFTQTHALLTGSPAIDAGNSLRMTDQRGLPAPNDLPGVTNAVGGNGSDIGAYEEQSLLSILPDFDLDDDVDGSDFLIWQRGFGKPNAARADGDSDNDNDVDATDLANWLAGYGGAAPAVAAITHRQGVAIVSNPGIVGLIVDSITKTAGDTSNITAEDLFFEQYGIIDESVDAFAIPMKSATLPAATETSINAHESSVKFHQRTWITDELLGRVFG